MLTYYQLPARFKYTRYIYMHMTKAKRFIFESIQFLKETKAMMYVCGLCDLWMQTHNIWVNFDVWWKCEAYYYIAPFRFHFKWQSLKRNVKNFE